MFLDSKLFKLLGSNLILGNWGSIIMADYIGDSLILYGKDATDFLNSLAKPLTERQKDIIERRRNHKIVYW